MLLVLITDFPIQKTFVISYTIDIKRLVDKEEIRLANAEDKKPADAEKTSPVDAERSVNKEMLADEEDLIVIYYIHQYYYKGIAHYFIT